MLHIGRVFIYQWFHGRLFLQVQGDERSLGRSRQTQSLHLLYFLHSHSDISPNSITLINWWATVLPSCEPCALQVESTRQNLVPLDLSTIYRGYKMSLSMRSQLHCGLIYITMFSGQLNVWMHPNLVDATFNMRNQCIAGSSIPPRYSCSAGDSAPHMCKSCTELKRLWVWELFCESFQMYIFQFLLSSWWNRFN